MADKQEEMSELSVYKTYMHNVHLTEEIQSDIIRGAKAGEDPFSLLLKALRAICLMTGSNVLYNDVELSMRAVYGQALGLEAPTRIELANTEERLAKLKAALETCEEGDNKERMKQAIKAHEATIVRLKSQLGEDA